MSGELSTGARYAPLVVVDTIARHFFARRGLEAAPPPSDDSVNAELVQRGYMRLEAKRVPARGQRDRVIVIVLAPSGGKTQSLKSIVAPILSERNVATWLDELIVVGDQEWHARAVASAYLGQLRQQESALRRAAAAAADSEAVDGAAGDPAGAAAYHNVYPYRLFVMDLPAHCAVAKHTVLTAEAAGTRLRDEMLEPDNLPTILVDDPPVVWAGGRVGQFVEVERDSETSGHPLMWRRIAR